jgi:hypothetical protein
MDQLFKYPRTRHIEGSGLQKGDDPDVMPWALLRGRTLVVEEKLDGANVGVSFSESGELQLQCRGHYLTGGPGELQFGLLKPWARTHEHWLNEKLGTRFVLYGEWLYAKHTVFYDQLPHYFHEFDVLDTETNEFLDTARRGELLAGGPVVSVPVLEENKFRKLTDLTKLVGPSLYKSEHWKDRLREVSDSLGLDFAVVLGQETDGSRLSEGLYLKWEEDGIVKERYKFVRPDFLQAILDSGTHWKARVLFPNQLAAQNVLW